MSRNTTSELTTELDCLADNTVRATASRANSLVVNGDQRSEGYTEVINGMDYAGTVTKLEDQISVSKENSSDKKITALKKRTTTPQENALGTKLAARNKKKAAVLADQVAKVDVKQKKKPQAARSVSVRLAKSPVIQISQFTNTTHPKGHHNFLRSLNSIFY